MATAMRFALASIIQQPQQQRDSPITPPHSSHTRCHCHKSQFRLFFTHSAIPPPACSVLVGNAMADWSPHKAVAEVHILQDAAHRDSITKLNATQSPLLRLPAEIRNAIYTFVFSDQVYKCKGPSLVDFSTIFCAKYSCQDLLLASRQVHHKTALLPYKLGTFVLEIWDEWDSEDAQIFLAKRSQAQLAALGRMEVMWCKKRWNGTAADFLNDIADISSGTYLRH